MNPKLGVIVVLYNPAPSHISNIHTYLEKFDKAWVVDNSENNLIDLGNAFEDSGKVEVIQDGVNKGIAKAINIVVQKAIAGKYSWLLTMDQDSFFEKKEIDNYVNTIQRLDGNTDIALVGVNIEMAQEGDCTKSF